MRVRDARGDRLSSLPFSDRAEPFGGDAADWDALVSDAVASELPLTVRSLDHAPVARDPRFRLVGEAAWHGLPLTGPLEEVHARASAGTRRNLRAAASNGVRTVAAADLESVRCLHRLHVALRKRKYRMLAQPLALFERIWSEFASRDGVLTVLARVDDRPIAAALYLVWNDVLYYKFGASIPEELPRRPNEAIHWTAIRWAKERGLRLLDWGLSDLDQPGLLRFKRKWGSVERRIVTLRRRRPAGRSARRRVRRRPARPHSPPDRRRGARRGHRRGGRRPLPLLLLRAPAITVLGRGAGRQELGDLILAVAGLVAAAALAVWAALAGPVVVLGVALVLVVALCAYRPVVGTYLYLATLPFIAGFERGAIPLLRPNEALLLLVLGGALLGAYLRHLAGAPVRLRFRPAVDAPLAAFVLLCTAWPLASLLLRGEVPREDELLALLPAAKLAAVFLLVRMTVLDQHQLVRVMRIIDLVGVRDRAHRDRPDPARVPGARLPEHLHARRADLRDRRAGQHDAGVLDRHGDVIAIGLILVIACAARGLLGRRERLVAGLVLAAGVLAAGQFSTWIAALVAAVLILHQYPDLRRRAVRFLPVAGVAVLVGAPALIGPARELRRGIWRAAKLARPLGQPDHLLRPLAVRPRRLPHRRLAGLRAARARRPGAR